MCNRRREFKRQIKQLELEREAREHEKTVSSDFSWLRTPRQPGRPRFLVTRTACFYDCTRGVEGQADGLPTGLEGRGMVRYARQGEARVPCLRLPSKVFLVARVPFSKNGGGDHLNQYTVTMHVKVRKAFSHRVHSCFGLSPTITAQSLHLLTRQRVVLRARDSADAS